jgi:N-acetylmuramoyl-L-alanine amidase
MRHLDEIVIHCTATTGDDAGDVDIDTVRRWHTRAPRSWSDVGYHYLIRRDGSVEVGRPLSRPGAHVRGHNASTIGIVYTGGIDADTGEHSDTRTDDQRDALFSLIVSLAVVFPTITRVRGHRDFPGVSKSCPCFDVPAEFGFLFDE